MKNSVAQRPEERETLVDTALTSARRLLAVLDDVLDYSKLEAGELVLHNDPFDLHELLMANGADWEERARKKGLAWRPPDLDGVPPRLVGDAHRLEQVLENLLSNAIRFTDAGHVALRCAVRHRIGQVVLLRFEVEDSGPGIPPEHRPRLFEAFSQGDGRRSRRHQGTGLGLALVRRLLEALGGRISVESETGAGTTFVCEVRFALDEEEEERHPATPPSPVVLPDDAPAVLLVDDEATNRLLTRRLLERAGCRVVEARSGEQALAAFENERPALIFMDVEMPGWDGMETTRRIRLLETEEADSDERPLAHLPIVGLTAHDSRNVERSCRDAGMTDFLCKPIDGARLTALLEDLLGTRT